MGKPFFSVIVPAHNAEDFLRKCLDSVRMQDFNSYELIVVCDACTDGTEVIASKYADKLIVTDYGRDGLARNAGIDAAEGEWLLFLDHDDWWIHEYVMAEIWKKINEVPEGADLIVFDFLWKGVGYYVNQASRMNIAVWSKAFRREFVGDTRFSAVRSVSDVDFMNGIIEKRPRCYKLDRLMYYYDYMRPGSQTELQEHGGDGE